jgi:hypothetical protein
MHERNSYKTKTTTTVNDNEVALRKMTRKGISLKKVVNISSISLDYRIGAAEKI